MIYSLTGEQETTLKRVCAEGRVYVPIMSLPGLGDLEESDMVDIEEELRVFWDYGCRREYYDRFAVPTAKGRAMLAGVRNT